MLPGVEQIQGGLSGDPGTDYTVKSMRVWICTARVRCETHSKGKSQTDVSDVVFHGDVKLGYTQRANFSADLI